MKTTAHAQPNDITYLWVLRAFLNAGQWQSVFLSTEACCMKPHAVLRETYSWIQPPHTRTVGSPVDKSDLRVPPNIRHHLLLSCKNSE